MYSRYIRKRGSIVLLLVIVAISYIGLVNAEEQCLKDAWTALNHEDYKNAIKYSDKCIDEFGREAARKQAQLEAMKIPDPPTGPANDAEKNQIFERGLLNDVAAAYFIKGKSSESLYKLDKTKNASYKEIATKAYESACKLKYGRVWDPKGWFWSPCVASSDRLPID
jgi:hypothetical protein